MTNIKKIILLAGDLIILYLSLAIALLIRYGSPFVSNLKNHLGPFSLIFLAWMLVFYLNDLYRYKIFRDSLLLFKKLGLAVSISAGISIIVFYLFSSFFELTPKTNLLIFSIIFLLLDFLWRYGMIKAFATGAINIILIGESKLIKEAASYLKDNPQAGYKIVSWIKDAGGINYQNIKKIILENHVNIVVIPNHLAKNFASLKIIYKLLPLEVNVMNFWNFFELIFEKAPLDELEESWFIENIAVRRRIYDTTKRIFDIILALALSAVSLPFIIIFGAIIKLTSPGPVIYKQERVGKNSALFTLYKFRTMRDGGKGPLWTTDQDKRITTFGKFLRLTHLDELPQLLNILKDDISFIGPRPERKELVLQYQNLPYYEIRHIIKPGLTGWAQINFKPSASLEEAQEKLGYDIYYIKNRSFFLDSLIFLKTIKYLFVSHYGG